MFLKLSTNMALLYCGSLPVFQQATTGSVHGGNTNSLFVEVFLPAIISLVTSAITATAASLVFGFHFIRERRAAATFGFYASFRIVLKDLRELLTNEHNPYIAMYPEDIRAQLKAARNSGFERLLDDYQSYLKPFESVSFKIREMLLDSENNVYPKRESKISWYNNQFELYKFTQFIVEKTGVEKQRTDLQIHVKQFNQLCAAIDFLISEIDEANYLSPKKLF